ncbi:UNVERIFIED_CONTAM: hypothetical protein K2H54_010728 [Gekko kuhli]
MESQALGTRALETGKGRRSRRANRATPLETKAQLDRTWPGGGEGPWPGSSCPPIWPGHKPRVREGGPPRGPKQRQPARFPRGLSSSVS